KPTTGVPSMERDGTRHVLDGLRVQLLLDLGGNPRTFRTPRNTGVDDLHDLPHRLGARCTGLTDGSGDQLGQFVVGKLLGQVLREDLALGALRLGLVRSTALFERLSRLAALLGLTRQQFDDLFVSEVPMGGTRGLLRGDCGQHHTQSTGAHLVTRLDGGGQVILEAVFEFGHGPDPTGARTGRAGKQRPPRAPDNERGTGMGDNGRALRRLGKATAITGAVGAVGLFYASVVERNWFCLRRYELPLLPPGSRRLRVLHLSDAHLTPGRKMLIDWIRE